MSRLDDAPSMASGSERPLVDLPLRHGESDDFSLPLAAEPEAARDEDRADAAAGLTPRATAWAADAATILLVWAAAVLGAAAVRGQIPRPEGFAWAAAFLFLLSFFAVVPALILFGKTVGMAVAGLSARPSHLGRRLAAGEATRRWIGTLATGATLGIALLFTGRSPAAPTPADRLSGRTLEEDEH